jgi:hypothetical protein
MAQHSTQYGCLTPAEVYPEHERTNRSYPHRETAARFGRYFGNLNMAEYHLWAAAKLAKRPAWLVTDDDAGELAAHLAKARRQLNRARKLRPPSRLPAPREG